MSNETFAYQAIQEAAKRPRQTMAKEQHESSDTQQLRSEVALLRAQVDRYEMIARETEAQKRAFADFLTWVALTAEEKTQLEADKRFAGLAGETWEVQLQEHPKVRLPAHSEYEAVGRYNEICGITGTAHKHQAGPLAVPAAAAA